MLLLLLLLLVLSELRPGGCKVALETGDSSRQGSLQGDLNLGILVFCGLLFHRDAFGLRCVSHGFLHLCAADRQERVSATADIATG